jgi:3-oxoacyl-[acyl-carrier-protein] synthase-3
MARRSVIVSTGSAVPSKVLSNADLERMVETNDEWIRQRTGISERRMCSPEETSSSLSILAARQALERAGLTGADLDMVICGTVTGDMPFPSTACLIQDAIGANRAGAFDVGAACAGFIYSLSVGSAMVQTGQIDRALVVGVDTLTKYVDWTDRATCVLFGDGAGCVIIEGQENTDRGVLNTVLLSDGSGAKFINCEVGGSLHPLSDPASQQYRRSIFMAGAETYRFAVNAMGDACCRALEEAGMEAKDIDLFVPHQANIRIIQSAADRLGLPPEKVFINVERYGNTSGGSIPLALDEAVQQGRLKQGMVVMTVGFGAGLVWGANVIRW